jgi:hypothetical protein
VDHEDRQIRDLAEEYGIGAAALRELLSALIDRVGADSCYVFWTSGNSGGAPGGARTRTLLAFPTPDAALVFAQRNHLAHAHRPRVRRLSLVQLLRAMLREPAITAILFVADDDALSPAGRLPPGFRIERADLLGSLGSGR